VKNSTAALSLLFATVLPTWSQAPPPNDEATHNELRALRDGLIDAVNKNDIERQLTYLHPNVVSISPNGEVSRGREGVRAYWAKMMTGPQRVVESFHAEVKVDELTILYGGDTGISFGTANQHYKLVNGTNLDLVTRWSATLVKEGDRWLVASFHASANVFDNPLLAMAKRMSYLVGGLALVAGWIAGYFIRRRR
jgi:ketosteroid isomerase-like protein